MWEFTESCRVAGALLCLLMSTILLREHSRDPSARASVFLLAGVTAHLVLPLLLHAAAPLWLIQVAAIGGFTAPFALWLLAKVHFDDDFTLAPRHALLLGAMVAVGYLSWLAVIERRFSGHALGSATAIEVWAIAPKLIAIGLVVHALIRVYVGARSDLLASRIRLRKGMLVVAGTYMLLELLGELVFQGSSAADLAAAVHSFLLLGVLFGVAVAILRTAPQVLKPAAIDSPTPAADPELLNRLKKLVEVEEVFREEGLSIRGLAERLGSQEYKLRDLINSQLGFKNFNAFLHHYRIREASKVLADPTKEHLGVAEVAYDVGYRSLATFNKAFKDLTGRTPTEMRGSR
jgi:AraC-like DNA-binding protein